MIAFGTKAETLATLRPLLTQSIICESTSFTVAEWSTDRDGCLKQVVGQFTKQHVIVRSSAQREDTAVASMAGAYRSVLDVDTDDTHALAEAIDAVVESYATPEAGIDRRDQVLVQPMVNAISMSGVLFTQDLNTGGPYWVINYDDVSGKTDAVTSGAGDNSRTLLIHRGSVSNLRSTRFRSLMEAVIEIEALVSSSGLDIEFAVTTEDVVYILQVRELAVAENWNRNIARQVDDALAEIRNWLSVQFKPHRSLLGSRAIFGVMPDWNPVEMIGSAPRRLAGSLYRYLITDSIWAGARARMGYRDLSDQPLMISLGGRVYIDVRKSFNSFLPADVSNELGGKIVDSWLDRLAAHPELHDKIEFDIASTCHTFSFDSTCRPLLEEAGLSTAEIDSYGNSLRRLTERIIGGDNNVISAQLDSIEAMVKRNATLAADDSCGGGYGLLATAKALLLDCRRDGTLPFSILARCGFIAEDWLRACVEMNVVDESLISQFRRSIKTVVSEFLASVSDFHAGRIEEAEFFGTYGHLRPGTYDILSKRYDQRGGFSGPRDRGDGGKKREALFELPGEVLKRLDRKLSEGNYQFNASRLFAFISGAMAGREYGKLKFTQNLSDALERIARWGEINGLSREELSHLSIEEILEALHETSTRPLEERLRNTARWAREARSVSLAIRLPFLITNLADVDVVPLLKSRANFVTHHQARAPVTLVTGQEIRPEKIANHIVLIESADPGFDWIFLTPIRGLITKYGGANSHMAIRCAELDIPAAIGCGEQVFDRLEKATEAAIDCGAELITPIG
jgi:glutamine kinase